MSFPARRGWRRRVAAAAPAEDSVQARCRSLVTTRPQQAVAVCEQAFVATDVRRKFELADAPGAGSMAGRRRDCKAAGRVKRGGGRAKSPPWKEIGATPRAW